jgi:hypothetical protein
MQELMWTLPVSMYGALGWRWTDGRIFAGYLWSVVSLLQTCLSPAILNYIIIVAGNDKQEQE